jgi:hypothetical protein
LLPRAQQPLLWWLLQVLALTYPLRLLALAARVLLLGQASCTRGTKPWRCRLLEHQQLAWATWA